MRAINLEIHEFRYEVIGDKREYFENGDELLKAYELQGFNENECQRWELQRQPKLAGLLGPMYGGMKDGKTMIRYESQKVYSHLCY